MRNLVPTRVRSRVPTRLRDPLVLWFCVLAALFALTQLSQVTGRASVDTTHYLSHSLMLSGKSREQAAAETVDYYCTSRRVQGAQAERVDVRQFTEPGNGMRAHRECRAGEEAKIRDNARRHDITGYMSLFAGPRTDAIFVSRPGYPLLLVPFIALLGVTWGIWAAAVTVTVAAAALVVALLRLLGAPVPVALAGSVVYYVTPLGTESMRPLSEGLLMVGVAATALTWTGLLLQPRRTGRRLCAAVLALALTATVKYSQALLLAACMTMLLPAVLARKKLRSLLPTAVPLLVLCACAAVLIQLTVHVLHLPSTRETMQDLLAFHFRRPDVPDPWPRFWLLSHHFWLEWTRRQFLAPLFLAVLAAGAWGILRHRRAALTVVMTAVAGAALLNQAAHPDITVGNRLLVTLWFLPAVGLPLLWMSVGRKQDGKPGEDALSGELPVQQRQSMAAR